MSGYSAVMFTGYAGIAYTYGVTSFVTWSFPIALGIAIGSKLFAPRINRLRSRLHVASPLEYLKNRYNLPTQQALAWSGMLLKIVDVGAKWAAIATLLSVFTGVSLDQASSSPASSRRSTARSAACGRTRSPNSASSSSSCWPACRCSWRCC